ncbi:MAG: sugar phosphate isomerase/epimerase [Thermoguttaceae bacterium]|nr:sugar phosphate isomerase/epimerase [Thermoguttaceae bacterium]
MQIARSATRREFLKTAAAAAATPAMFESLARLAAAAEPAAKAIRLGGPLFDAPQDPDELARAYRAAGYRAAYCPQVAIGDTDRIRALEQAFARHDVVIAEVGRWVNMLDADPAKRAANIQTVTEGLALADAIGARCCVDIAGSFNEQVWYGPHPKNISREFFDAAVENARKIIDAVEPKRARFAYEMMGWALPDSPQSYLDMIKAVDRPAFAVHLDPCNLINSPRRFFRNAELLDECFDKLGPWIVSCHAKDLFWEVEMNVHFREVTVGAGALDYTTYLKRLAALPADVPLMIEHMPGKAEYDQSREHLFGLGKKIGVEFE